MRTRCLTGDVAKLLFLTLTAIYISILWKADLILPEFIFRDAEKIQAQIGGSDLYSGTSFDAVGKFYAMFGSYLNIFVAGVGVVFLKVMCSCVRTKKQVIALLVLSAPCVFFNLFVASKDTIVVLMSVLVVMALRGSDRRALVLAFVLYACYALLIRNYFALIMMVSMCLMLFSSARFKFKVGLAALACVLFAVLPNDVYLAMMGPRDKAVDYLLYSSPFGARTAFYNPLEPNSLLSFVFDYLYAIARLNFAPLFALGAKELLMQIFVVAVLWPALRVFIRWPGHSRGELMLACLIVGHVAVSMLFEPDLGSYLRHLSSVSLYAMVLVSRPRTSTRKHSSSAVTSLRLRTVTLNRSAQGRPGSIPGTTAASHVRMRGVRG